MAQHGMDSVIYKISEAGVPLAVFAADTVTFDGVYDGTGVNGLYSSYSQFVALDSFDDEADMVAGVGERLPPPQPPAAFSPTSCDAPRSLRLLQRQPDLSDGRWHDHDCRKRQGEYEILRTPLPTRISQRGPFAARFTLQLPPLHS